MIVVGGGPAGLSAALVLGRCNRRVLVPQGLQFGRRQARRARAVEVQIDDGAPSGGVVVVLRHGVRVEGLSIADVAALAMMLS